jgi:hypothetical protein
MAITNQFKFPNREENFPSFSRLSDQFEIAIQIERKQKR